METGSQQELEQRLALVRPEDTVRGFFFSGVLARVRKLGDEVALRRCLEVAGDTRFMAFFSYPVSTLHRLLYTAAWALSERHGGFSETMRHLGHWAVLDYLESSTGRALLVLGGREPKRMVSNLPMAFRTVFQHGECVLRWSGPSSCTLVIRGNTLPMVYFEGAAQCLFEAAKMANVMVRGRQVGLSDTELDISW